MSSEVITSDTLVSMADEVISTLRSASEVNYVHNIKQLQDSIRAQYERFQFNAKHLFKTKTRELKILEEQANEPHVAAFEAKRAELEEQQQQLMDNIRELQAAIAEHDTSRKNSCTELQQLKAREKDLTVMRERSETLVQAYIDIFYNISSIDWEMDSTSISGVFWGNGSTREFSITPKPNENVVNTLWDMIDDAQGFEW